MRTRKAEQSNSVMGPMPLSPASSARQLSAVPMPTGVTSPMPVMTTRSMDLASVGGGEAYFLACFSM